LQNDVRDLLASGHFDERKYSKCADRLRDNRYTFTEAAAFVERYERFREIQSALARRTDVSELQQYLEHAQREQYDAKILEAIEAKLKRATEIRDKVDAMLASARFDESEIEEVRKLQREMGQQKLALRREVEVLRNIRASAEWLTSVYAFYKRAQGDQTIPPKLEMIVNILEALLRNGKREGNPFSEILYSATATASQQMAGKSSTAGAEGLRQLVREGAKLDHHDARINNIYRLLAQLAWEHQASQLLDKGLAQ
jgi:hypothetical protein